MNARHDFAYNFAPTRAARLAIRVEASLAAETIAYREPRTLELGSATSERVHTTRAVKIDVAFALAWPDLEQSTRGTPRAVVRSLFADACRESIARTHKRAVVWVCDGCGREPAVTADHCRECFESVELCADYAEVGQ